MKILLVSATKFEITPLLKKFRKISAKENISSFRFGEQSIDVLITGVGMTATAFHLGKILNKKYDLAINAGIAGSFKKNIPLGTVVNVTSDCFADLGAEDGEKFLALKEMGMPEVRSQKSEVRSDKIRRVLSVLPKVKGITVNTAHGNSVSIKKVIKKFNPDIESMEGAAFFLACNHEKISCVQIRAISNYVVRRNKKNWNIKLAVSNLSAALEKILSDIQ
ncbi:MAG: futalosine hydrolase [Bacteroidetes bacterium]|nr:futalosine hydrolase [Bacteroidota bacterium]